MASRLRMLGVLVVAAVVAVSCGTASPTELDTATPRATEATPAVTFWPSNDAATAIDAGMTRSGVFWARTTKSVFVSSDGGSTWLARPLPAEASRVLSVADERHIWLLGHPRLADGVGSVTVYRATGAVEWQATSVESAEKDAATASVGVGIYVADETHGFLVFAHYRVGAVATLEVWRTSDGGATWSPSGQSVCAGCVVVAAMDASTLWAQLSSLDTPLAVSRDAGTTWTPVHIETYPGCLQRRQIAFFGASTGVYACVTECPAGECSTAAFYTTLDGGRTWTESGTFPDREEPSIGSMRDWFVVASPNYSYGGPTPSSSEPRPGSLLRTADAGATWSEVGVLEDSPAGSSRPAFAGSRGLWLRGTGPNRTLYLTSDDGRTWKPALLRSAPPAAPS